MEKNSRKKPRIRAYAFAAVAVALTVLVSGPAPAQSLFLFLPGNLVVSLSVYDNNPNNVSVGETLPPNCTSGCGVATNNGSYPEVFDNVLVDPSFGITSRIFLDQITPFGLRIGSLEVPDGAQSGFPSERGPVVTSFSSKSELALNLSTDRRSLTFMGYVAPIDTVDVSNANTPGVIDPTNPVPGAYYRAAAKVDAFGAFRFTETNAYSGDNGRAAIFNDAADAFYTSGNAGNGNNPQPLGVILGAGAQFISPSDLPLADQDPGTPTPLASFSITELPANKKPDKIGKDDNFRGLTIFNNVVYYTKGSGSNGINTVYFVDTTGTACPDGIGLPASGATLPTSPLAYDPSTVATDGLPNNMCILNGFNTTLAKTSTTSFPFGLWFANANTVYVADEGDGTIADAGTSTTAGLQKWIFNTATSTWQLAYVLQNGLGLGVPYTVSGYPTGINPATGVAWAPETDGLRNITGIVERNGTATIYAITSTVSGGGDQGADPNKLVAISDNLSATTLPASESFKTIRSAGFGEVLRGVSWTPDIF